MTEKMKKKEISFAAQCMLEKLDEMLSAGEITEEQYRKNAAKIYKFSN